MFYSEQLQFLENIFKKCHLQLWKLNPSDPLEDCIDQGLRRLLGGRQQETFFDFFPAFAPQTLYRVADTFFCHYFFLMLPEGLVLSVGPYLNEPLSRQNIMEQCERIGLPPKTAIDLEYYYMGLPIIKEDHHLLAMMDSFAEYLWGGAERYETKDLFRENTATFLPELLPQAPLSEESTINLQTIENRYIHENQLIDAVSKGNFRKAEQMISGVSELVFEMRTPDLLRNLQNYCIVTNTLFRKAAEKGGVHPYFIDKTSSSIAKSIELLHSVEEASEFLSKILNAYCQLVQKYSHQKYSPLIRSVAITIDHDLTADLSLNALATAQNVSASYLSARFKKETGKTLTDFVNHRRIEAAKQLLRNSSLQIQTIAQHCGILDLHYFCRLFKRATGKTPSEYRSTIGSIN